MLVWFIFTVWKKCDKCQLDSTEDSILRKWDMNFQQIEIQQTSLNTNIMMIPGVVTCIGSLIQLNAQNYYKMAFTVSINKWENWDTEKFGGLW